MGVVHLAEDHEGRRVALKVLRPQVVGDEEGRRRLEREVASLRHVQSPHVAEVLDADPWGEHPYVVTRYVPGHSLHETVERDGPLRLADLLHTGRRLLEAVRDVHAAGVLHRDLKPTNVVMEGRSPILIDFGLARLAEDPRLTMAGTVLGTPGYLAPEVLYGDHATAATDVHGWAATTAYAATGRPPYGRGHTMAILDRTRRGQADLRDVPVELRALLADCLATEPLDRPTVAEAVQELEALAEELTEAELPTSLLATVPPPVAPDLTMPWQTVAREEPASEVVADAPQPAPADRTGVLPAAPTGLAADPTSIAPTPTPTTVTPTTIAPTPSPTSRFPAAPAGAPAYRTGAQPGQGFPPPPYASPGQYARPYPGQHPGQQPVQHPGQHPGQQPVQHAGPQQAPFPGQPNGHRPPAQPYPYAQHPAAQPAAGERLDAPGRLRRALLMGALTVGVVAAYRLAPYVTYLLLLVLVAGLRGLARTQESLWRRRVFRGRRWSDAPRGVATFPWHTVLMATASVLNLLTAAVATAFTVALLVVGGMAGRDALWVGGVVTVLAVWCGPGSRRLRRPVGQGATALARHAPVGWGAAVLAVAVAAGLVVSAAGGGVEWWPTDAAPWSQLRGALPGPLQGRI